MPLQHRHDYAADLHRGLLSATCPTGEFPAQLRAGARCSAVLIHQVRAAGSLEGRSIAGSSRTPFRRAGRTRTVWQCWPVPSLSELLSALTPVAGNWAALSFTNPLRRAGGGVLSPPQGLGASWRSRSTTHSRFGAGALNSRPTRSAGRCRAIVGVGGDHELPASAGAGQAQLAHEALHGAAAHPDVLPVELGPDLVGAIDTTVLGEDPHDVDLELLVADRPVRLRSFAVRPVGVRGDLAAVLGEHRAGRLDPEAVPVSIDEATISAVGGRAPPRKTAADFKMGGSNR